MPIECNRVLTGDEMRMHLRHSPLLREHTDSPLRYSPIYAQRALPRLLLSSAQLSHCMWWRSHREGRRPTEAEVIGTDSSSRHDSTQSPSTSRMLSMGAGLSQGTIEPLYIGAYWTILMPATLTLHWQCGFGSMAAKVTLQVPPLQRRHTFGRHPLHAQVQSEVLRLRSNRGRGPEKIPGGAEPG